MEKSTAFTKDYSNAPVYGIDLGTTNSAIALVKTGNQAECIPITYKEVDGSTKTAYTMPSVVMWKDGEFIVGHEAYQHSGEPNVCSSIKRIMEQPIRLQDGSDNPKARFTFRDGDKELTMTNAEISAEILKGLVEKVSDRYLDVHDVVITVPAYFRDTGKANTRKAAELAGLNNIVTINEPTAAAMVYKIDDEANDVNEFIVYDLGGGTFDISLIREVVNKNDDLEKMFGLDLDSEDDGEPGIQMQVITTDGDSSLGGDDVDRALVDIVLSKAGLTKDDVTPEEYAHEKYVVENWKKIGVDKMYFDTIHGKEINVTYSDFYDALDPSYKKTKVLLDKVVAIAKKECPKCKHIYLVGGSTKHPILVQRLREDYPDFEISDSLNPDLSVALGAAKRGKGQKFKNGNIQVHDIVTQSIGFNDSGKFKKVLKKGTVLPAEGTFYLTNVEENQKVADVELFQGDARVLAMNSYINTIRIKTPGVKEVGSMALEVKLVLTANNVLRCVVKNIGAGYDENGNEIELSPEERIVESSFDLSV